jgi:hypothetical protein
MGRTYLFECEKCGYRVKVAGGGAEGLEFTVQTIQCYQCRELQDVVTALKVPWPPAVGDTTAGAKLKAKPKFSKPAPPFGTVINRLPLTGRIRARWQHFKLSCPVSALHQVRAWNQPDKCPRCGVFLERSAIPFRQWD